MIRQRLAQIPGYFNNTVVIAGCLVVLTAVLGAACSPAKPQSQPAPSTPSTTLPTSASPTGTPSESPADAQRHALDAYIAGMNAFTKASETADPAYPDLTRYVAGAALQRFVTGLTSMRKQGLRGRGQIVYHPTVASFEPPKVPTKVHIRDCADTTNSHEYRADGGAYSDPPGGLRLILADVEKVDGVWKLTAVGIHEVGSCAL